MSVVDIIAEQDEAKAHTHQFILWTKKWSEYQNIHDLNWRMCPFKDEERANIPTESGIYTFLIRPEIASHPACSFLMYVGKTKSLHRRFGEYLSERNQATGRPKIVRLLNKYGDYLWFCFTVLPEDAIADQERALINAYIPPFNDQYPAEIKAIRGAF